MPGCTGSNVCAPCPLCTIDKVQFSVHITFWFGLVLFWRVYDTNEGVSSVGAMGLTALVFASIFLHELGHVWAMRRLVPGIPATVIIHMLGGVAMPKDAGPLRQTYAKKGRKAFVHFCGPAVNLMLGVGGMTLGASGWWVMWVVGVTNLGLFVFNMLPISPMDGGEVLLDLLCICMNVIWACYITYTLAIVMGVGLAILFFRIGDSFTAIYGIVLGGIIVLLGAVRILAICKVKGTKQQREQQVAKMMGLGEPVSRRTLSLRGHNADANNNTPPPPPNNTRVMPAGAVGGQPVLVTVVPAHHDSAPPAPPTTPPVGPPGTVASAVNSGSSGHGVGNTVVDGKVVTGT